MHHRLQLTGKRLLQIPFSSSKTSTIYKCPFSNLPTSQLQHPNPNSKPRPIASPGGHCHSSEIIVSNRKITSYIRCGDLKSALEIFRSMKARSTVTWNSILAGLSAKPGRLKEARDLFDEIPEPDTVSYNIMLSCYFRNAHVDSAKDFFDRIPAKDAASWNTMITGLSRNREMRDAEEFFRLMPERNGVTWNAMISGYAEKGEMEMALELLKKAPVKGPVAWTSIITGYMRRGEVGLAERIFSYAEKNVVTWNAMIAGYVENGREEDGLNLFKKMTCLGCRANPSGLSSLLLACSNLSMLKLGKQFHQLTCKLPVYENPTVGTSLISMYCKCGVLEDGKKLFSEMSCKDVVSWNAMISGYAQHGLSREALNLFNEMKETGMRPDWITFVGVLSACNHAGYVDIGISYFEKMQSVYGIMARPDHYTCMIDLLGRAGKFDEAMGLIKEMPFEPHAAIYGTLLGACRVHKNVDIAEFAAEKLLALQPCNPAAYVQLANVYAVSKNWESVSRVRKSMKEIRAVKTPGYSWIEIKSVIHEFRSGDRLHSELGCIHEKLSDLERKMRLAGYVPVLESALHDVGEEQKQKLLLWHSEKLAIAFGLMRVESDSPIRVFKNLRVCDDCHLAIKFISAVERREIIVRDTTRFHHFRDGNCSCGDYW
ncbi:Pentatricopeptide repeat-containing protein -mitochondrial [Striga hermonthica]|uniref:Pentatricopeptide repeat-containing protein -mitochondrial n=1 Tax=Striga hermonthica TaxID=68872 RepID=A0A9N7RPR2_STRHE|nr:Pentatricopeptide repeat-containing protein -mitochondrial [Striga hermonthica]